MKISLIITYKNEKGNLRKIFNQILNQSKKPNEIIFIDSLSTDDSYKFLNKLIKEKKVFNIKIKNLRISTEYPSDSKNLGIQVAENSVLAFMDCGLIFDKEWLKKSAELLNKNNLDAVLGNCKLDGFNLIDKVSIAHTYGVSTSHNCIPGSLIKKKIFYKIGYFLKSRSFYDVEWKNRLLLSKFKILKNSNLYVKYQKINYAKNYKELFLKSFEYYSANQNILKNKKIYIYFLFLIISIKVISFGFKYFIFFALFYFLSRIFLAFLKSEKKILNINFILNLPIACFVIDSARILSLFKGIAHLLGFKGRIPYLILLIIIMLYTPFIDLFGNKLIDIKQLDLKRKYDAIIIFSGDGKIGYNNSTYRERALDAINYYKLNVSKKLLFSSGKEQNQIDIKFIKSFLITKGAKENDIKVFVSIPSSTYQNIIMVGNYLTSKKYNNIIFVTSPYHYLRSNLIWKKNFKNIQITSVKTVDTKIEYSWKQNFRKIGIIIYEYFSIFYNWLRGRL